MLTCAYCKSLLILNYENGKHYSCIVNKILITSCICSNGRKQEKVKSRRLFEKLADFMFRYNVPLSSRLRLKFVE